MHPRHPAPSTWTLNVAKSDFGGIPGMKSDVWHIVENNRKRLKYTDMMVLDSGEKVPNSWEGPQDGTLQAVPGMPGTKASFKLDDDSGHMEMSDGSRMDMVMTLSPDRKTLTLKMTSRTRTAKSPTRRWSTTAPSSRSGDLTHEIARSLLRPRRCSRKDLVRTSQESRPG